MTALESYEALIDDLQSPALPGSYRVTVGMATCGLTAGAQAVYDALAELLGDYPAATLDRVGCIGSCFLEPIVEVFDPQGQRTTYVHMTPERAREVLESHIKQGRILEKYTIGGPDGCGEAGLTNVEDAPYYQAQTRIALRRCGLIDPEDIDQYLQSGGYRILATVLDNSSPQDIIDEVSRSGLRGRGGAGFPTGRKWQFTAEASSEDGVKYVACNADEGDPGAFMDRSVLESDPHAVIEAMIIAAFATGAQQGYIYIRAEYPIGVKRLHIAIDQAMKRGLLGDDILGSGFGFHLGLRLGAGAFVCGEETALMTSVEGNRGEPRPRPPFPALKGLFGRPTLLNNVETYANITWILEHGGEAYAAIGTEGSAGTKVFALGGKIRQAGLVEVAMGTTLRTIVEKIGGGCADGKAFKAAQTGGPSGGCIPHTLMDTPIDYESLAAIGSMMGSGGLIVMDEDNCMVDIAKFFLDFVMDESCGKCVPCRIGSKRLYELVDKITRGEATSADLELIEALAAHMQAASLCALGQSAPNPVLSTMRHFRDEYLAHVEDRRCPASACKDLLIYRIDPELCTGCTKCQRVCPTDCISGKVREVHTIDISRCIRCGSCYDNCRFGAISRA